jgi:nucleoside-diphosphate-sugar epimerase
MSYDELDAQLVKIQPELCIHLAWYAVPGKSYTSMENTRQLNAGIHLASKLSEVGCKRFVGVGTCIEYDTDAGLLSETTPLKPRNLYAACKAALFTVLEQLSKLTGMKLAWVRPFYQYGPFEDERRLMPAVITSLLRNQKVETTRGDQVRDYLHVEDVASAIWAVAKSNLTGAVNLGSGKPYVLKDIISRMGDIIGRPELILYGAIPSSPADPVFICSNNRRLVENTGWSPKYGLEEGLRHTIAWWRKQLGVA